MVYFNRILGCCLVGLFGLIPFTSFAGTVRGPYLDQGVALSACNINRQAAIAAYTANYPTRSVASSSCTMINPGAYYGVAAVAPPSGGYVPLSWWPEYSSTSSAYALYSWPSGQTCSTRPLTYNIRAPGPNGSGNVCDLGCVMSIAISASGDPPVAEYEGAPTGSTCTPGEFPEPVIFDPSDTDGDGFPNETDPCPTDPENACVIPEVDQDDDGIPDNMDPCPSDPTNQCSGTDTPTDPENPGGGGFDCVSPPVCGSSGGLSCSQLYQSWASRCASERSADNTDGLGDSLDGIRDGLGDLGDALDGSLDALGDRIVDAVNDGTAATNAVKGSVDGVKGSVDGLRGDLSTMLDGSGVETPSYGSFFGTKVLSAEQLDTAGLGLPRACSTWNDIVFPLPGGSSFTIPLSQSTYHCDILELTSYIVLAMSAYFALLILMRP